MRGLFVFALCFFIFSPIIFLIRVWAGLTWAEVFILAGGISAIVEHLFHRRIYDDDSGDLDNSGDRDSDGFIIRDFLATRGDPRRLRIPGRKNLPPGNGDGRPGGAMMFEYENIRRIQYESGATFVPVCEK